MASVNRKRDDILHFVAYAYFYIIYVLFQNMQPQTGPTDPLRLRIKSCVSW